VLPRLASVLWLASVAAFAGLLAVLLGGPLDPAAAAVVDRAVIAAYTARGITSDPRTHPRPAGTNPSAVNSAASAAASLAFQARS